MNYVGLMLIVTLLLSNCRSSNTADSEKSLQVIEDNNKLLENQINSIEKSFKALDSIAYTTEYWYKFYVQLKASSDSLILNLKTDKFSSSLESYIKTFPCELLEVADELNGIKHIQEEVPNAVIINKIRAIELRIANYYFEAYSSGSFWRFTGIWPVVVSSNDNIKLGDSFSAKVYLAGMNDMISTSVFLCEDIDTNTFEMLGKIDTLVVKDGVAIINLKTVKRGKNKIQGAFFYNRPSGSKAGFPFVKEFTVY